MTMAKKKRKTVPPPFVRYVDEANQEMLDDLRSAVYQEVISAVELYEEDTSMLILDSLFTVWFKVNGTIRNTNAKSS